MLIFTPSFGHLLALTQTTEEDRTWAAAIMQRFPACLRAARRWIRQPSNLSNAGTKGFRAEREYFRNAIMGPDALNSQLNRTVNDFGVLGGNRLDLGQGPLVPTGNPLDLAIEGSGFFAIQTTPAYVTRATANFVGPLTGLL